MKTNDISKKVNFKKFIKITKKVCKTNNSQEESQFKSFTDENFDVNSQYDLFMKSMR